MKHWPAAVALMAVPAIAACQAPAADSPRAANAPLIVKTASGDLRFAPRNVANGECTSDDCVDFKRVDRGWSDYALVQKLHYEGSEWLLIETGTGTQQTFSAEPHFSPDRQRVVVINNDETGDGEGSGSFVYQRGADGRFAQVAHFPLSDIVPMRFDGWQSPDCVNLAGFTGWGKPGFDTTTQTRASISRQQAGGWSLSLQPCPATD